MAISGGVTIKADTAALRTASDTLRDRIQKTKTSYDNVLNIVKNTKGYWVGEAGDEHRRIFADQQDDIEQILARLQEHRDDLLQIAGIYEETEPAVTELSEGLNANLIS